LTYMDLQFINIKKLLDIVWECWRSNFDRQNRSPSILESILKNKRAYTELTISNIKDIDAVITTFISQDGDFNKTEFLTSISRLFTYISELEQLIKQEKVGGITFYHFVEGGCLEKLIKLFNTIKKFEIK
jgi:hypothetical protein